MDRSIAVLGHPLLLDIGLIRKEVGARVGRDVNALLLLMGVNVAVAVVGRIVQMGFRLLLAEYARWLYATLIISCGFAATYQITRLVMMASFAPPEISALAVFALEPPHPAG